MPMPDRTAFAHGSLARHSSNNTFDLDCEPGDCKRGASIALVTLNQERNIAMLREILVEEISVIERIGDYRTTSIALSAI